MGLTYADIELVNSGDIVLFNRGYIKENEIRKEKVNALVDSGANMLCINEKIKSQLGLDNYGYRTAQLADGQIKKLEVVGPVDIRFLNRSTTTRAMVLPGDAEILLGVIPLEDLDVILDPLKQTLALPPDRPYLGQYSLK
jgi:clan AA aspartic protease